MRLAAVLRRRDELPDETFDVLVSAIVEQTEDQDDSANRLHVALAQTALTSGVGQDVPPASPAGEEEENGHLSENTRQRSRAWNEITEQQSLSTRRRAGASPPGNSRCGRNLPRCGARCAARNATVWSWRVDTRRRFPHRTGLHLHPVEWSTGGSACGLWECRSQECSVEDNVTLRQLHITLSM